MNSYRNKVCSIAEGKRGYDENLSREVEKGRDIKRAKER